MNICAKYGCLRHTVQFFQRTFLLLVSVFNLRFKGKEERKVIKEARKAVKG